MPAPVLPAFVARLALAATFASALAAQTTGRTMTAVVSPRIGSTAQLQVTYPSAEANNLGWYLFSTHQVGSVAWSMPGYSFLGSAQINLFNILHRWDFMLAATGTATMPMPIPNEPLIIGFAFDVQEVDLNATTSTIAWSNNDLELTVAGVGTVPLPNFVAIPAGSFWMGSTFLASPSEQPVHQVTISQSFWMDKYEVTQAEYQAVIGSNPSYFSGARRPVEQVSWNQAMVYCAALTTTERAAGRLALGYEYRLPTEAEWEYCCRAGTATEWNTGTSLSTAQANFGNPSGQTVPVGSYAANAFGLFDMHGNVWEWCLDAWDGSNNYPSSAVTDPYVSSGPYRVFRGGSLYFVSNIFCRSAIRNYNPSLANTSIGFRVVCAPVCP